MAPDCGSTQNESVHLPVLAEEAVRLLACSPGKVVVDATIGGGGHAELILERIGPTGTLIGLDWDDMAIDRARRRLGKRDNLILIRENFRNLAEALERLGRQEIDSLLLDLGLSSFHLEEASRGFSFMAQAPLDMRMDKRLEVTADDIVNTYSEKRIADILWKFGEEPNARRIARAMARQRSRERIRTTSELADIVRKCAPKTRRRSKTHPATRTFQALRIEVNSELENLKKALDDGVSLLESGGRVCVISFHSLEDRIVKRTFVRLARGCDCAPELPQCVCGKKPTLRILTRKPIRPSEREVATNPRSRSARMRAAEKMAV